MGAREEIIAEIEKYVSTEKDIFPEGIPGDTSVEVIVSHAVAREMMSVLTGVKRETSARWQERAAEQRKEAERFGTEEKKREAQLSYLQACAMTDDFAAALFLRGRALGLSVSVVNRADKDIIVDMAETLRRRAFEDLKATYLRIPYGRGI